MLVYVDGSGYAFVDNKNNIALPNETLVFDKIITTSFSYESIKDLVGKNGGYIYTKQKSEFSCGDITQSKDYYIHKDFVGVVYKNATYSTIYVEKGVTPSDVINLGFKNLDPRNYYPSDFSRATGLRPRQIYSIGSESWMIVDDIPLSGIEADYYCFDNFSLLAAFGLRGQSVPCYYYPNNVKTAKAIRSIFNMEESKLPILYESPTTDDSEGVFFTSSNKSKCETARRRLMSNIEVTDLSWSKSIIRDKWSTVSLNGGILLGYKNRVKDIEGYFYNSSNAYFALDDCLIEFLKTGTQFYNANLYLASTEVNNLLAECNRNGNVAKQEYLKGILDSYIILEDSFLLNYGNYCQKGMLAASNEVSNQVNNFSRGFGTNYIKHQNASKFNGNNPNIDTKAMDLVSCVQPKKILIKDDITSISRFVTDYGKLFEVDGDEVTFNDTAIGDIVSNGVKSKIVQSVDEFINDLNDAFGKFPKDFTNSEGMPLSNSNKRYRGKNFWGKTVEKLRVPMFPLDTEYNRLYDGSFKNSSTVENFTIKGEVVNVKFRFKYADQVWFDDSSDNSWHSQLCSILRTAFSKDDWTVDVRYEPNQTVYNNDSRFKWSKNFRIGTGVKRRDYTIRDSNWNDFFLVNDGVLTRDKASKVTCPWKPCGTFTVEITKRLPILEYEPNFVDSDKAASVMGVINSGAAKAYSNAYMSTLRTGLKSISEDVDSLTQSDVIGISNNNILCKQSICALTDFQFGVIKELVDMMDTLTNTLGNDFVNSKEYGFLSKLLVLYSSIPIGTPIKYISKADLTKFGTKPADVLAPLYVFFGGD